MKQVFILFSLIFLLIGCHQTKEETPDSSLNHKKDSIVTYDGYVFENQSDTSFYLLNSRGYQADVHIMYPDDAIHGCILLLHGWNLPAMQWCDSTDFCEKALENNYALVIPELSLCNYPLEIYPECLEKYRKYPDLPWIVDSLIPAIFERTSLLEESKRNFVAGISTGGRGASLLAYYMPDMFRACASISGDFDITAMQDEFLYKAWFGDYDSFPERWEKECFAYDVENYKVPIYIAHGQADKVSPCAQSQAMYDSILLHHPDMIIEHWFPESYGHDYSFWAEQTEPVLNFFALF